MVKKGDLVKVISGKYKGTVGRVLKVFRKRFMALVEGVNMKKRSRRRGDEGASRSEGFDYVAHPVHVSKLKVVEGDVSVGNTSSSNESEK